MSGADRYMGLVPILAWQAPFPAVTVTYADGVETDTGTAAAATLWGYETPASLVGVGTDPIAQLGSTTSAMGRLAAAALTASSGRLATAAGGIVWTADSVRGFVGATAPGDRAATLTFASVAQANAYGWRTVGPHAATRIDLGTGMWAIVWVSDWLHDGLWVPRPEDADVIPSERRNVTVRQSAFGGAASVVRWSGREHWTLRLRGIPWARVYRRNREDAVFASAAGEDPEAPYNLLSGMLDAAATGPFMRAWLFDREGAELPAQVVRVTDPAMFTDTSRIVQPSSGAPNRADVEVRLQRVGEV